MANEKGLGMVKNSLFRLIQLKLSKMDEPASEKAIEWFFEGENEKILQELRKINPKQDVKKLNSDENGCFMSSILHAFRKKCPEYF